MKKPLFVITEIFLSAVFVAAAAATAAVAVDIKTDMFHIDKLDPLHIGQLMPDDKKNEKDEKIKKELSEIMVVENKQASETQESFQKIAEKQINAFLTEPEGLESQPKELEEFMLAYEYSFENDLTGDKLILVEADNFSNTSKAKLYCYEKSEKGYWWNIAGEGKTVTDEVYIAQNGSAYEVTADSKKTPAGMWLLGEGFYIGEKPETSYPLFEITENTYWVTDTESSFFNQKVEGTDEKDWTKAEHMSAAAKSYKYGLVIDYNTYSTDPEKPSAIFMHCGNTPTEGCIAVPENVMKAVLEWLDDDCSPFIWITV